MSEDKVKQLAATLKKQGLAASMYEAMEKARRIIGVAPQKQEHGGPEPQPAEPQQQRAASRPDYDINKETRTVGEVMGEAGVNTDEVQAQEQARIQGEVQHIKDEVQNIKEDFTHAQTPEKVEEIKEKMHQVQEEVQGVQELKQDLQDEPETEQAAETQQPPAPEQQDPQQSTEEKSPEQEEQEDRFSQEKKIDLSKVFGNK